MVDNAEVATSAALSWPHVTARIFVGLTSSAPDQEQCVLAPAEIRTSWF
jgi:hypothetical protein